MNHKFVELIPETIEEKTLYISIAYNTVIHKCCCGCGNEIVTPLAPEKWKVIYNGQSVSLSPSIGSWDLPCQSHYLIIDGEVIWAKKWTKEQIEYARVRDIEDISYYYDKSSSKEMDDFTDIRKNSPSNKKND